MENAGCFKAQVAVMVAYLGVINGAYSLFLYFIFKNLV
jgi:hypothetical protein